MTQIKRLPPIIVGITGASGAALAQHFLAQLTARGREGIVVCTAAGAMVWQEELGVAYKQWATDHALKTYSINDIGAPIASGTFHTGGMAVIPCSMNSLAAIAHGMSSNLLERAADVTIKESRPLVLVPRETPLSVIHLRNMLTLAELGVKVVPPMPPFYAHPQHIDDIIDHTVARVLVALGVDDQLPQSMQYGAEVE